MLTPKKKEYFKRLLNKKAEGLFEHVRTSAGTLAGSDEDGSSSESFDFTDQATLESLMDLNIHIKERDGRLIIKIKDALERIEDGTYGICEECEREISESRLKARPETTMCIDCKKKQEAKERQRGL